MSKFHYQQTKFNAGIYDAVLDGYRDAPKREYSIKDSLNMLPMVQGGMIRRGGSVFIGEVKNSSQNSFLYRFKFNALQAVCLEFGDNYIRFYEDRVQLEGSPSVPLEVATVYDHEDFFDAEELLRFQFLQSADVIYIVHPDYKPYALKRFDQTTWQIDAMDWVEMPYTEINGTDTTLTAASGTGTMTVTASSTTGINNGDGFKASDVGRGIRLRGDTGETWGWGVISTVTNSTTILVDHDGDSQPFSTSAEKDWRLGAFSDDMGWPAAIGLYNDRICLGGAASTPDYVFLGATGGYSPDKFDFSPSAKDGVVGADDAITRRANDGEINVVQWFGQNRNGLLVGTSDKEWVVRPASTNSVLAPDNAQVELVTSKGSAAIPSKSNGFANIFLQKTRKRVHEIAYSFEVDGFRAPDVSLFFVNSLSERVCEMEWVQEPDNVFMMRTEDGNLHGMTYFREEGVVAWSKHQIAGGDVKSTVAIPSPDASRDDLYMIVEREIDGQTVKYIEYIEKYVIEGDERSDSIYADSCFVYDDVATSTVSGLDHLEGETVGVLVDGKTHPDQTVSGGEITLSNGVEGSKIVVGLRYPWRVVLHDPAVQTADGASHGKMRNVTQMVVRLWKTLGFQYGQDGEELNEATLGYGISYDDTIDLYTGDTEMLEFPEGNNRSTNVRLEYDGLLPACILGIRYRMNVQDN